MVHRMLKVTTQAGIRKFLHPMERRVKTRQTHFRFPTVDRRLFSDTMFVTTKSVRGHKCAQVFTDGQGWDQFIPMHKKNEAGYSLNRLIDETRVIPRNIVTDDAMEETGGTWKAVVNENHIVQKWTEPYSPWQNKAESSIRELKKFMKRVMIHTGIPKRLWCFVGEWCAAIRRLTAHDIPSLDGRVPEEGYTGNTPEIAPYAQFDIYQYVWYMNPHSERKLGRWLGPAKSHGAEMTFWILLNSCRPIVRSSVSPVSEDELNSPGVKALIADLDADIHAKIGNKRSDKEVADEFGDLFPGEDSDPTDEDGLEDTYQPEDQDGTNEDVDGYTPDTYDEYLTAEVKLPRGEEVLRARVIGRKRDHDGKPIGLRNENPILDTREYLVEFDDGTTASYAANVIAENMFSQVDEHGNEFLLLKEIVDHRKDGSAVSVDDGWFTDRSGKKQRRLTTKGWQLLVEWKDGTTTWVPLKDMKESYPVQLAEYAVANKIAEEPAFAWWIRSVLRKRDRIIAKVKSRYWRRTHKYGIRLPHNIEEAFQIDEENIHFSVSVWG